jgi:cytochrome P450
MTNVIIFGAYSDMIMSKLFWEIIRASAPQTSNSPISSSNERDAAPFQRPSLLQSDPPYHRTLRGVIASAFIPIIIAKLESHIENIANEM